MSDAVTLIGVAVGGFLVAAMLAPLEALGWWAGWFGRERNAEARAAEPNPVTSEAEHFIIFLTGIHSVSERTFARRERNFLKELSKCLPQATVLEVFPYSVANNPLTGQRVFAWFWRFALKLKLSRVSVAGFIINLRNLFQVAVSADRRYGPIYNQGTAEALYTALRQHGYQPGSGVPVTLIGYSGGGQVAAGTAGYLKEMTGTPVTVISLGGIVASDEGLLEVKHLYHLVGERDRVQRLGPLLFPGRWSILGYSYWNQAKKKGLIDIVPMGPVDHTGRDGYLDAKFVLEDGRSSLEQTVDVITAIVRGEKEVIRIQ